MTINQIVPVTLQQLQEYKVINENELDRIENAVNSKASPELISNEICSRTSVSYVYNLLKKNDKVLEDYEALLVRDAQLQFGELEISSLKYTGQIRVVKKSEQGKQGDSNVDQEYVRCGFGKIQWPDESTFEGYWLNGQAVGIGAFRTPQREVYEGMWQLDKSTGLCVFRKTDCSERHSGRGIEVWSDGSYYFGNFNDGIKEGHGVYYWTDGSRYEGDWLADEMSGDGHFKWADGRNFEGEFKNGVMHGFGVYTWQDGRRYEGNYNHNKKHGRGTYTYSDGSKYMGEWLDGLQHGVGCIVDPDGAYERKGIWSNGKLKQWLTTQNQ